MASIALSADTSAYVAAIKRATKAAKKLHNALDRVERMPIFVSVVAS